MFACRPIERLEIKEHADRGSADVWLLREEGKGTRKSVWLVLIEMLFAHC